MKACDAEYDLLVERLRNASNSVQDKLGGFSGDDIKIISRDELPHPKKRGRPVGSKNKTKV